MNGVVNRGGGSSGNADCEGCGAKAAVGAPWEAGGGKN